MSRNDQNDWQSALGSLLQSGSLPESEEPVVEPTKEVKPRQVGKLRVDIERKGRAGKVATIISGFTLPPEEVERIAATLKSKLGTGGSARGGEILIQGDRRTDVISLLATLGLK
jgi:translation initiation factor 1